MIVLLDEVAAFHAAGSFSSKEQTCSNSRADIVAI
jgi:hypothetical protein